MQLKYGIDRNIDYKLNVENYDEKFTRYISNMRNVVVIKIDIMCRLV